MIRSRRRNAAFIGIVCAFIEGVLLFVAEPELGIWQFAQGVIFWFGCGAVVYLAETGLSHVPHAVALTLLLNAPWYIAISIVPGKPELLGPLVVVSLFIGLLIGIFRKRTLMASQDSSHS